jgi:hypothetical protein
MLCLATILLLLRTECIRGRGNDHGGVHYSIKLIKWWLVDAIP